MNRNKLEKGIGLMNSLDKSIIIGQREAAPFYGGQYEKKSFKKTSQGTNT